VYLMGYTARMKVLQGFFTALGVIFFVLILIGVWFYVADPYELRPLITALRTPATMNASDTGTGAPEESAPNPRLSPAQNAALETVGISPSAVPTSFTPEQRSCMIEAVGEARAAAIIAGALPTAEEFASARACL